MMIIWWRIILWCIYRFNDDDGFSESDRLIMWSERNQSFVRSKCHVVNLMWMIFDRLKHCFCDDVSYSNHFIVWFERNSFFVRWKFQTNNSIWITRECLTLCFCDDVSEIDHFKIWSERNQFLVRREYHIENKSLINIRRCIKRLIYSLCSEVSKLNRVIKWFSRD
jgi:hypothetical protein